MMISDDISEAAPNSAVVITNPAVGHCDSYGNALFNVYAPRVYPTLFAAQVLPENLFDLAQACGGQVLDDVPDILGESPKLLVGNDIYAYGDWVVVDKYGELCRMEQAEFESDFRRAGAR